MLEARLNPNLLEAGCDEAGRGCLAGPVYAAAVILPPGFFHPLLNDSKQLSEKHRDELRVVIEKEAISWSVAWCDHKEIDKINILQASIRAMHKALMKLDPQPEFIVIDGNRFKKYKRIPHQTVIKGDGKLMNIAAASILAKTHRDEFMHSIANKHPEFNWSQNKGYPTSEHREVLIRMGPTPYHRLSFQLKELDTSQVELFD